MSYERAVYKYKDVECSEKLSKFTSTPPPPTLLMINRTDYNICLQPHSNLQNGVRCNTNVSLSACLPVYLPACLSVSLFKYVNK
jgi:hypothetical protein